MENKFNLVQVQVLFTLGRCEHLGWSKEGNRAVQRKHKEGEVRVGTAADSPCLCWHEIMVKLMGDVLLHKGKIHNFNSQFTTLAIIWGQRQTYDFTGVVQCPQPCPATSTIETSSVFTI